MHARELVQDPESFVDLLRTFRIDLDDLHRSTQLRRRFRKGNLRRQDRLLRCSK